MTTIPLFSAGREFAAHRLEMLERIGAVLETGEVVGGPAVSSLEQRLATMAGRKHAVAVNSGTDALHFALTAAGIGSGAEVLVTDFSFVSSASAVLHAGARPIFVDVDDSYNMDLDLADRHRTPRTRALICVHLYGQMLDPARVETFARERGLILIEDAAQTIGASFEGRRAGSLGMVSCLSFNSTKTISAPGGGGAVLTDDDEIADRIRRLRYHGKARDGRFAELGHNSLMPTLTAAVLEFKLDRDAKWQDRRRAIAARYRAAWSERDDLVLPRETPGAQHIYHKFVVRSPRRAALAAHLSANGIEAKVHYPLPLHREPVFNGSTRDLDPLYPNALHFASTVLTLPVHAFLSDEEVERVTSAVRGF